MFDNFFIYSQKLSAAYFNAFAIACESVQNSSVNNSYSDVNIFEQLKVSEAYSIISDNASSLNTHNA